MKESTVLFTFLIVAFFSAKAAILRAVVAVNKMALMEVVASFNSFCWVALRQSGAASSATVITLVDTYKQTILNGQNNTFLLLLLLLFCNSVYQNLQKHGTRQQGPTEQRCGTSFLVLRREENIYNRKEK